MIRKLYVFANCGYYNIPPKSGGQSSARRVIKGLEQMGFEVRTIRRHRGEWEGKLAHRIETDFYSIVDTIKIFFTMLLGKRSDAAFLNLTYSGPLIPYEFWLTIIVRLLGYKSLKYIKGGKIIDRFPKKSSLMYKLFKKDLDWQSIVFFEGNMSLEMAGALSETPMRVFPNFIFDNQIPDTLIDKPTNVINICYFGKIAKDKNIHVILDTFEILAHNHDNLYLTIVGGAGNDASYVKDVDERIKNSHFSERINRKGLSSYEYLMDMMKSQHFFLFPSEGKCEGHSNSLNEAMSQGLVPIVSDYHFNKYIVGDDRLVVNGFNPQDYANTIEAIIQNNEMTSLSNKMWERVKKNYCFGALKNRIENEIKFI